MADMKRLLDGGGTPFERALLGAAAREIPTPQLHRRMRRALGIGFVATGAKLALALVPVASVALFTADIGLRSSAPEPAESPAALAVVAAKQAPAPPAVVNFPGETQTPPELETPKAHGTPAVHPARRSERVSSAHDLKREIKLLDQARAAVRNGSSTVALDLLRTYDQRYPRGAFRQEVAVLRVEALDRRGERARATDLARKFVAENPDSPHVDRVERVTQSE